MQNSSASCSSDAAKEAKNNWTETQCSMPSSSSSSPAANPSTHRSIITTTTHSDGFAVDSSESDDDDVSEVDSFIMEQGDLDEESVIETSKFLLTSEGADSLDLRSADPESQAKLEALLEAAGKLSMADGKHFADSDVLRRLTSSVSCALGKAAAFSGVKTEATGHLVQGDVARSLAEACSGGDVGVVKKLLDEGRSVNETTEEGESLLSLACQAGYYELAQVLLAMRANVEDRGMKGDCTPLMEAASAGHMDIVKLLIGHGADVNAQSSSGNTPLMYACAGGHEDVVRVLLEAGANVEDHNENGHTPLMEAASAGHVGVAKILLERGAGINTHSNEFKESALTLACYKGHLEMVRFLLEAGADQEHKTDEMHTALMEASMDGHVEVARLLLDSGAQVNMPADSFESPLTLAACGGHVELAMLLLERGAKIEEVNDEGYTPLMEAAREGHEEMVAVLFSQGADINAQTEETQETALTLACCGGFLEVADLLIKAGADIELGASTPLMEAAQEGHLELVRYLLDAGANVHARTQTGDTALTYACENGHTDVADLLLQAGANLEHESEGGRTPLMKAARAGHMCTVQFLISRGACVNRQTTNNDHTSLSLACAGGHQAVVEQLLAHGANPSHKLKDNSTMLIEASKGGHTGVVQLLLDYPHNLAPRIPPHGVHVVSPPENEQALAVPHAYLPNLQSVSRLPDGVMNVRESLPPSIQHVAVKQGDQKQYASHTNSALCTGDSLTSAELQQVRNTPHIDPEFNSEYERGFEMGCAAAFVDGLAFHLDVDKDARPSDRLEACINSMMKKADQQSNPEEQIYQKQQILEELQRMERDLQEKAKAKLLLGTQCCTDYHVPHASNGGGVNLTGAGMVDASGALIAPSVPSSGLTVDSSSHYLNLTLTSSMGEFGGAQSSGVSDRSQGSERVKLKGSTLAATSIAGSKNITGVKHKDSQSTQLPAGVLPACQWQLDDVNSLAAVTIGSLQGLHLSTAAKVAALGGSEDSLTRESLEHVLALDSSSVDNSQASQLHTDAIISQELAQAQEAIQVAPTVVQIMPLATPAGQGQDKKSNIAAKPAGAALSSAMTTVAKNHVNNVALNTSTLMGSVPLTSKITSGIPEGVTTTFPVALTLPSATSALLPCAQPQAVTNLSQIPQTIGQQCFIPTSSVATQYVDPSLPTHTSPLSFLTHPSTAATGTVSTTASTATTPLSIQNFPAIDVDSQTDSNHDTALTLACAGGHEDLVQLLLSRSAFIEHRDKKGFTPLILAATAGHVNVVEILLNHGADIEAQSERTKDTPLSLACSGGRYEVVEILLSRGANKEHRNVSDYTPLSLAASSGYVNIIKLLLNHGAEINSRTGSKLGISPLMLAAMNGHTAAVKLLLDMGSDINAQIETNRNTALTLACFQGRHEVVCLLVDRKANVEHRAKTGLTPLMEAASGGHVEVGRVLLDKGADVNAPPVPSSRDTALTIAADRGHYRFVELLLSRGAQVDVKNKKGNSPLWLAANGGHTDVVQLLVSAGADIDSQDNRKVSCLMAAFRKGHIKVVKWMVKHVTQFPSDQEMTRFITTVNDKARSEELLKKCHQCLEMIRAAKDRQAAEANKNATLLLVELDMEKTREESKRATAARRRERKRQKKKEKQERKMLEEENRKNERKLDDCKRNHSETSNVISSNVKNQGSKAIAVKGKGNSIAYSNHSNSNVCVNEYKKSSAATSDSGSDTLSSSSSVEEHIIEKSVGKERMKFEMENARREKKEKKIEVTSRSSTVKEKDSKTNSKEFQKDRSKMTEPTVEVTSAPYKTSVMTALFPTNKVNNAVLSGRNKKKDVTESDDSQLKPLSSGKPRSTKKDGYSLSSSASTTLVKAGNLANFKAPPGAVSSPKRGAKREDGWKEVVRRSKKVLVPSNVISRVIGRGGCHINAIREMSGAIIEIEKQKGVGDKTVIIRGSADSTRHAHQLITVLIKDPDRDLSEINTKSISSKASSSSNKSSSSNSVASVTQTNKSSSIQSSGGQANPNLSSYGTSKTEPSIVGVTGVLPGNVTATTTASVAFHPTNPPFPAMRQINSTIRPGIAVSPISAAFPTTQVWPVFPGPGSVGNKRSSGPPGQPSGQQGVSASNTGSVAVAAGFDSSGNTAGSIGKNATSNASSAQGGKSSTVRQLFSNDKKSLMPGTMTYTKTTVSYTSVMMGSNKTSKTAATTNSSSNNGANSNASFAAKVIESKGINMLSPVTAPITGSINAQGRHSSHMKAPPVSVLGSGNIRPAQSTPNISQVSVSTPGACSGPGSGSGSSNSTSKRGTSLPNGPVPLAAAVTTSSPTGFLAQPKSQPSTPTSTDHILTRQMSMPVVQANSQRSASEPQHSVLTSLHHQEQLLLQSHSSQQQQQQANVTQVYSPFNNLFSSVQQSVWGKDIDSSNKGMNFASVAAANVKATMASSSTVNSAMAALESERAPVVDASKAPGYRGVSTSAASSSVLAGATSPISTPGVTSSAFPSSRLPNSAPCTPPLGPIAPPSGANIHKESSSLLPSPTGGHDSLQDHDTIGASIMSTSAPAGLSSSNHQSLGSPPPMNLGSSIQPASIASTSLLSQIPEIPSQLSAAAALDLASHHHHHHLHQQHHQQQQQHPQHPNHHQQQQQHPLHHHHQQQQQQSHHQHPLHHHQQQQQSHQPPLHHPQQQPLHHHSSLHNSLQSHPHAAHTIPGMGGFNSLSQHSPNHRYSASVTPPLFSQNGLSSTSAPAGVPVSSSSMTSHSVQSNLNPNAPDFSSRSVIASHGPSGSALTFGRLGSLQESLGSGGVVGNGHGASLASLQQIYNPASSVNVSAATATLVNQAFHPTVTPPPNHHPASSRLHIPMPSQPSRGIQGIGADFPAPHLSLRSGTVPSGLDQLSIMGALGHFPQNHLPPSHPLMGHGNSGHAHLQPIGSNVGLPPFAALPNRRSSNNTPSVSTSSKGDEVDSPMASISPASSPHPSNPASPMAMGVMPQDHSVKPIGEDRKLQRPIGTERARAKGAVNSAPDNLLSNYWPSKALGLADWSCRLTSSDSQSLGHDDELSSLRSRFQFRGNIGPLENRHHQLEQPYHPPMINNPQPQASMNSSFTPYMNGIPPQLMMQQMYSASLGSNGYIGDVWGNASSKLGMNGGNAGVGVGQAGDVQGSPPQLPQQLVTASAANALSSPPSALMSVTGQMPGSQHVPEQSMVWNSWM